MRARWLARLLMPVLMRRVAEAREPDFVIRRGSDKNAYLRRWWVIPRNRWLNVYLHNMLRDDDDVLHDHMYASVSLVLTDGLEEIWCRDPNEEFVFVEDDAGSYTRKIYETQRRVVRGGDLVWRSSRMAHQLLVRSPAWTLFVTGPRVKEWGFWCPRGFQHWKKYVTPDQTSDKSGASEGLGCGEMS